MESFSRLKTVNFTWITYQWVWIMQINLKTWQDFFAEAIVRLCSISVFQHHFLKGKFKTMFSFVIFLFSSSVVIWDFLFCFTAIELASSIHCILFLMVKLCDVRVLPHYPWTCKTGIFVQWIPVVWSEMFRSKIRTKKDSRRCWEMSAASWDLSQISKNFLD